MGENRNNIHELRSGPLPRRDAGHRIDCGALLYGETRQRLNMAFDGELRKTVLTSYQKRKKQPYFNGSKVY